MWYNAKMNETSRSYIFVGRSGSGKGTQINLLKDLISEKYNKKIYHIEMGGILRKFFDKEGFVQKMSQESTNKHGKLQPDFLVNSLLVNRVIEVTDEESMLLFDGYPRDNFQLETLKDLLTYLGYNNSVLINLNISRQSAKDRLLKRERVDDHEVAINNRLDAYDDLVIPMIERAKKDPFFTYIEIDGEKSVEDIYKNLIEALGL